MYIHLILPIKVDIFFWLIYLLCSDSVGIGLIYFQRNLPNNIYILMWLSIQEYNACHVIVMHYTFFFGSCMHSVWSWFMLLLSFCWPVWWGIGFPFWLILSFWLNLQYYMRTGTCKYGASCKYHHPRQGAGSVSNVSLNYYGYPLRPVCIFFHLC